MPEVSKKTGIVALARRTFSAARGSGSRILRDARGVVSALAGGAFGWLLIAGPVLLAGCSVAPNDNAATTRETGRSRWHFADLPVPVSSSSPTGTVFLIETGRFGSADGADWLSNVGSIAVSDRVLVVATPKTCELVVFERSSRKVVNRFGSCGEGPDEFDRPSAIALHGDTLVVTDRRGVRVRWLSLEGRSIREARIDPPLAPSGERWTFVAPMGDSGLLMGAALESHDRRGGRIMLRDATGHYLRAWFPGRDTSLVAVLRDGPGVADENYGYERSSTICAGRFSSGVSHVSAWNDWIDQTVSLDLNALATGRVVVLQNVSQGFSERTAKLDDYAPPRMASNGLVDAACGLPHSMSNHRWWRSGAPMRGRPTDGRLTVYDDAGAVATMSTDQQSPVLMTRLLGAYRDSFFFGSSVDFEYPLVIEMKLRVTTGGAR